MGDSTCPWKIPDLQRQLVGWEEADNCLILYLDPSEDTHKMLKVWLLSVKMIETSAKPSSSSWNSISEQPSSKALNRSIEIRLPVM